VLELVDHWVEHRIPCPRKSCRLQEQQVEEPVDELVVVGHGQEPFGFERERRVVVLVHC